MVLNFVEGKHGHLFLDNDSNGVMQQIQGEIKLSEAAIDGIFKFHQTISNYTRTKNIKYMHVVAPNKETSLREYLPDGIGYEASGPTPIKQYFNAKPDAKAVTYFDDELLLPGDNDFQTYPFGDTHWTQKGTRKYLVNAFRALNEDGLASRLHNLPAQELSRSVVCDLSVHAGRPAESVVFLKFPDSTLESIFSGSIINEGYVRHYRSKNGHGRALILHDSFVHTAYDMLASLFSEALFIHIPDYSAEIVENFSPDYIIRIQAERFFLRQPMQVPSIFRWIKQIESQKSADASTSQYLINFSSERQQLFKIVPLQEIPEISVLPCLEPTTVPISPVEVGHKLPFTDRPYQDFPEGEWTLKEYSVNNGNLYVIPNAVVHGEAGIITVGNQLVRESLYLAFPEAWGMERIGSDYMSIPAFNIDIRIEDAAHAMSGGVGSRNYGHWWANVVPALRIKPFYGDFEDAVLLMPSLTKQWQRSTLELLPEVKGKAVFLGEKTKVECNQLRFVPRLLWGDYTPHPDRSSLFKQIRIRAGSRSPVGALIFISRADSNIRQLVNEQELIEVAAEYGFESLTLAGRSVAEQVRIFSNARYIVSPHGAGLCNVSFCEPGTTLLELHKHTTVQWSIRRTCSAARLRYGCLVGYDLEEQAPGVSTHDYSWHLPANMLRECLEREYLDGRLGSAKNWPYTNRH